MDSRGCPTCSDQDVRLLYEVNGLKAFRCHSCGRTFNTENPPEPSPNGSFLTNKDRDVIISRATRMSDQSRRLREIADQLDQESEDLLKSVEPRHVKVSAKHR